MSINENLLTLVFALDTLGLNQSQRAGVRNGVGKMTTFGYSRVSTSKQDLQSQVAKLKNAGAEKIYSEKYTGTKKDGRKQLSELLEVVKTDDKVLVTKIDRLARSIVDLKELVQAFLDKGVTVTFVDNNMTFKPNEHDSMQTLMLNMLGSFAEFERDLIVTRTAEGKAYAKANNKNFKDGRPKRRLNDKYLHAIELMETNTMKDVEKKNGISRSTLFRIKKQAREEKLIE